MKRIAILPALVLAAACAKPDESAFQGYAEGEFVRVATPFAGTLVSLDVARGATVAAGAPLFALESENEAAARREAESRARRAESQLENLRKARRPSEIEAVRAQRAQARTAAALADTELKRQEALVAKGFVSPQRLDESKAALAQARARVEELDAQVATANLAARPDEIRAAEAELAAARAALAQADWRLGQKRAVAPVAGEVADTLFARGEWVGAGQPVVTLLPPENRKARFHVPQGRLAAVKVGQAVELACDGCGAPIAATVTWVSPQAEYTPPVIYSRESRAKLVHLAEAKPAPADAARLRPGQPLDVRLK